MALELGPRASVNGVNADRVRSGIVDEDFTGRGRPHAASPPTSMSGNLIREVEARHVAEAFITLADQSVLQHVMPVDGGNIEAAFANGPQQKPKMVPRSRSCD